MATALATVTAAGVDAAVVNDTRGLAAKIAAMPHSDCTISEPRPSIPAMAVWLGVAGLLPFLGGMAGIWALPPHRALQAASALAAYAAVIASFLGGIHWGLVARGEASGSTESLLWGVTPSLLAWAALLLPNMRWTLAAAALTLLLCWAVDTRLYRRSGIAHWLPLRHGLTAVAAVCCFAGAAGV
jgi:Protein of unknown function (DUF3429)